MATTRPKVVALVVAAGAGRRIGGPKALVDWQGERFLDRILRTLADSGAVGRAIVVLGAEADRVHAACAETLAQTRPGGLSVTEVVNPGWDAGGMLSSLLTGLTAASALEPAAVLHWPVDHPAVTAATVRRLLDVFGAERPPVVVPEHAGRRGHPVVFAAEIFDALREAPPDQGARAVVRALGDRVRRVEVADPGVLLDVDTPADLERLRHRR